MPQRGSCCLIALTPLLVHFVSTQGTSTASRNVQRDPQAVIVLNRAITAAGGLSALSAVQDLRASGTIAFNWSDENVSGDVTIKSRGTEQIRLETNLPDGARIWIVSNGRRVKKDADGITIIPYRDPSSFANVPFPFAHLLDAMQDASLSISFVGIENRNGADVNHVRIGTVDASISNAIDVAPNPQSFDVFVDTKTSRIQSVMTVASARDSLAVLCHREIWYSDYRPLNGVSIPFSIAELIDGQQTFSLQLSQVSFNTGLSDSDFAP